MKKTALILLSLILVYGSSIAQTNDIGITSAWVKSYTDTTYFNYQTTYSKIPMSQANKTKYTYSAAYKNFGSAAQPNTKVNLRITGPGGFLQTGNSTPKLLPVNGNDINFVLGNSLNGWVGNYKIDLFPTSDSILTNTGNDTASYSIEVTDSVFARYKNDPNKAAIVYYNPKVVSQYEAGTYFETSVIDTISSVSFYMPSANAKRSNKPGLLQIHVYRTLGLGKAGVQQIVTAPLFSSKKVKISDLKIPSNGGWVSLKVKRNDTTLSDTVHPGGLIASFVADQFFGTDTIFLAFDGRKGWQSHYVMRQEQSGKWANWGYTPNEQFITLNLKSFPCPILNGSISSSPPSSCGLSNGSVSVTAPTNGGGPYRYSWNVMGAGNTRQLNNLTAGIYKVTLTDTVGCTQQLETAISDTGGFIIFNKTITNVNCGGKGEGKICFNLHSKSVRSAYIITWFDEKGVVIKTGNAITRADSCLQGVEAGKYTVVIEHGTAPKCKQIMTFTISGPKDALGIFNKNVIDVTCNGDKDGTISIQPKGGKGTITTSWTGGLFGKTLKKLGAGTYVATLTDSNKCTYSETFVVGEPTPIVFGPSIIDSGKSIAGTVIIKPSVSGGTRGYSFTWKNSAGQVCTANATTGEINIGPGSGPNQEQKGCYTVISEDTKGCRATKSYCVDYVLSVAFENSANNNFRVFPNPNNGSFHLLGNNLGSGEYQIEIKNILGKTIYFESELVNGEINKQINISESGIFFLTIIKGSKNEIFKIVVD